ncbi:MAG: HNH endonuclease [Bacteroidales bacterium]|nr:HNH endonuclease [Bacteroidales bacterium]
MVEINDYMQEKTCTYKGEEYLVRDNGAVKRMSPNTIKARPLDNVWTFGKKNESNGYMTIGSHRVHIIVATAFYGPRDSKVYVVDHIDTNRCNNRIDNLRWLTKLENVLLNDITRRKIEWICGSVENFLKDPSMLRDYEYEDRNFEWMRTVSKEEAENTLKNWKTLMDRPKENQRSSGPVGEWIFDNHLTTSSAVSPKKYKLEESHDGILQIDNIAEDISLQKEDKKEIEQKQLDSKHKEAIKRNRVNTAIKAIISISKSHGWTIEKNVSGNNWKADLVVKSPNCSIGFMLYKTTRGIKEKQEAMRLERIKACWLGSIIPSYDFIDELFPCFDIEIQDEHIMVKMSETENISLEDLIVALMSNRLQVENDIIVNKIKIRFTPINCYLCGKEHYLYHVIGIINEKYPSLASSEGLYNAQVAVDEFNPNVQNSVKRYLLNHSKLFYPMGEIKKRFSKTLDKEYLSFGCPYCDALVGDYYYRENNFDHSYDLEDENVHIIDLESPGIEIVFKHWIIS